MKRRKVDIVGDSFSGQSCALTAFDGGVSSEVFASGAKNCVANMELDSIHGHVELSVWRRSDGTRPLTRIMLVGETSPIQDLMCVCCVLRLTRQILWRTSTRRFVPRPPMLIDLLIILQWISEVSHYLPRRPVILVGCKADLRYDQHTINALGQLDQKPVSVEQGEAMRRRIGA